MVNRELYLQSKWFTDASPSNPKPATATLTFTDVVIAAETVSINDQVYEFVALAANIADPANIPVVVGTTLTADNAVTVLAKAINDNSTIVTAVKDTTEDTVVITYNTVGTAGNDVEIETTCTKASFGEDVAKLSGGQYGTPCPIADVIVYVTPHYYWCEVAGNKDDVVWKRFIPGDY